MADSLCPRDTEDLSGQKRRSDFFKIPEAVAGKLRWGRKGMYLPGKLQRLSDRDEMGADPDVCGADPAYVFWYGDPCYRDAVSDLAGNIGDIL